MTSSGTSDGGQGASPGTLRVLVIGPRRGLLGALDAAQIPYVVWSERPRSLPRAQHVHVAPIPVGARLARREAEGLLGFGPFTHVIAGGESAVVPASAARRTLGARQSSHSTVIRCRDKLLMKEHLQGHRVPMTPFVRGDGMRTPGEVLERLGLPLVAKLRSQSGGRGIEIIRTGHALPAVMKRRYVLERFVDAPEVSVEAFVSRGQVLFESVTGYAVKTHVNVVPATLEDTVRQALVALNRRVIDALDIDWGMTHAEFYLTPEGPLFGEVALRPPGGYIMDLLQLAWGLDPWRAYLAMELDREFEFPDGPPAHAAAVILHPGAGTLAAVHGLDDVRAHPAVVRATVRVRRGAVIPVRAGVGNDVGHVLLRASTHGELQRAIAFVRDHLRLELTSP